MSQSTIFSYVGMGLPGLNQYKKSYSRAQNSASGEGGFHDEYGYGKCSKITNTKK